MPGKAQGVVVLSDDERATLMRWTRRGKTSQALAMRARIVLACADGTPNTHVAAQLGVSRDMVGTWRSRFVATGLEGLADEPRPGAPRKLTDAVVEAVIVKTLESTPAKGDTPWSTRSMALETGLSQTAVSRIWRTFGLKPHRVDDWKLSTDPQFIDKVRDIVGLYLDPPVGAMVLAVDEKSQMQALDRTAPLLPTMPGPPARQTHDSVRHGTPSLFAALDITTKNVIGQTQRQQELLRFLKTIDTATPADLELHLILDNYATHKTPQIHQWLVKHPRFHLHFTPTYSSWLNLVEHWFWELTNRELRRSTHRSVAAFEADVRTWIDAWNADPKPFIWTKPTTRSSKPTPPTAAELTTRGTGTPPRSASSWQQPPEDRDRKDTGNLVAEAEVTTIKAVAKLAGVSPSTVSYVLSGARPIGNAARRRVLNAIAELNYQPNSSALALRTARTNVLALQGFVTAGRTESAVTGVFILAVADAARERGFDLLLLPTHEGAAGIERLARTSRADAVVVMSILLRDPRVDALRKLRFPAALIGHPDEDPGVSWVDLDFATAGRKAVELLTRRGHDAFAFIGPPASVYEQGAGYAVRALQGAREASASGRIEMLAPMQIDNVRDLGADLDALFARSPGLTAIVLQYEEALPELLRWMRAQHRRVPEDVQVVLVGAWNLNNTESQVTYVSSTISQIASAVVELAIQAATRGGTRSILLPPQVWDSRQ